MRRALIAFVIAATILGTALPFLPLLARPAFNPAAHHVILDAGCSGVLFEHRGVQYVLTAGHCAEWLVHLELWTDGTAHHSIGQLLKQAAVADLALYYVVSPFPAAFPMRVASVGPPIGAEILHVGNPTNGWDGLLYYSRIWGRLSYSSRYWDGEVFDQVQWWVVGGCSGGGAWYNGALVGIVVRRTAEAGMGFMVPVAEIRSFLEGYCD